jgi:hypothetical protein
MAPKRPERFRTTFAEAFNSGQVKALLGLSETLSF